MTVDLAILLGLLVLFLVVAIGGLAFFLYRISQFRTEAADLERRIKEVGVELDEVDADLRRIAEALGI